ncbi:MAG TPA: NHLP bacteriocin system secretion protein [Pantanalinema sp.]
MSTAPLKPPASRVRGDLSDAERLDDLLEVVSPKGWIAVACLAVVTALIILWAVFGTIPVTVTGPGLLTRPHKVVGIQALGSGKLKELRLEPGSLVASGDVVATLELPELSRQLSEQEAKLALLDAQSAQTLDLQASQNTQEARAIAEQERNLQRLIAQARALDATLRARFEDRRHLYRQRALSVDAMIDAEQSYRANHDKIPEWESQLRQLGLRRNQMARQYAELRTARGLQRRDLEAAIAVLKEQAANQGTIQSRCTGRVLEVSAMVGQVITPGTRLATVAVEDADQPMVALLYFPISDGKKVLAGQIAQTTPDTVKRDRYGGIVGRVLTVSPFPVTRQAMASTLGSDDLAGALSNGTPRIEVAVRLDPDPSTRSGYHWSASEGPPIPQTPGTTVTTRVTVETLSPLQLAISLMRQASAIY